MLRQSVHNSRFQVANLKFKRALVYCFLVAICHLPSAICHSQFFQGIGVTAGVDLAKEKLFLHNPDGSSTQLKKNIFGYYGSLRAEFIDNENIRWVTEFQYDQKGCKDKTDSATFRNRLNNICWNNFLKFQYETFSGFPYLLFGPRIEYLLTQGTKSPAITGAFGKFNFSWSIGAGFENIVYGNFKPFIEIHYNPDTPFYYAYKTSPLDIRNRAWELRIGLIYRPAQKSCPGVVY